MDKDRPSTVVLVHVPDIPIELYLEILRQRNPFGGQVEDQRYHHFGVMAELVRLFHDVDTEQATNAVSSLVERTTPVIWETGSTRRVLATGHSQLDKVLLLTYSNREPPREEDLRSWIEAANPSVFRRDVLKKLMIAGWSSMTGRTTPSRSHVWAFGTSKQPPLGCLIGEAPPTIGRRS